MEKVSVIITLYNCAPWLERCLDSVINQTYTNLEILISDDCSKDRSLEIAKAFAERDNRIKIFEQPVNIGYLKQYNFLLQQATGTYIVNQDADDWAAPQKIERQVAMFASHSEIQVCGTGSIFHYPKQQQVVALKKQDYLFRGATMDYHWHPASIMIKRSVLQLVPGMREWFEFGTSMDRYFITEILDKGFGYYLNEPLYNVGVRANSHHKVFSEKKVITATLCDELIRQRAKTGNDWLIEGNFEAMNNFATNILSNKKLLSEIYRETAVFDIEFENLQAAFLNLKNSLGLSINVLNLRTALFFARVYTRVIIKPQVKEILSGEYFNGRYRQAGELALNGKM